ncbi:Gfo/Idh/MocA family oxidoreductase [Yoonia sp. F2084L]|uniref:Gfo/Idh/MocA family protein n=1 Tax=Yoonia sp. F2084L TaxID=2926419 RepID=UPI001FF48AD1|nr:Gfo/Idh/MocA family oxidoreductase [Yoonia sp. F2084L]MCK0095057.1 Gfo/Idh/MocA family oxidoreductase [Yoonia sp. F2084L]
MVLRVACIGAGYFAQFHIGSWQRMQGAALVGVCDLDRSRAEATDALAFDNTEQMLGTVNADIVDIILPPTGHAAAIRAAIAANPRVIICQKPFCTSYDEACEMTDLAEAAGIPLIIHENFRFQPWYRAVKEQIVSGRIGDPLQATFRLRPGDGQGPDAYLDRQPYFREMPRLLIHETGVHYVDVFRFLFGDPQHVYADLRKVNQVIAGEDAGYVVFDHPNGVRAVLDGNRCLDHAADNSRRTMGEGLFEGTKGTLTIAGDGAVHFRAFGEVAEALVLASDTHDGFGGDCTHALQSHVVAGLLDGAPFENAARDYLRVIETERAIYRSAAQHSKLEI